MSVTVRHHPEQVVPGMRLGAHYKEDDRNKNYRVSARVEAPLPVKDVHHTRHIHVMNQNIDVKVDGRVYHGLGSCVTNALIGVVSTGPFAPPWPNPHEQNRVVPVYETLSRMANNPNMVFPPHDKGAYVNDAMDYAKTQGWISEYRWAYSLDEFLQALMQGPCQVATAWPDSFDKAGAYIPGTNRHYPSELVYHPKSTVRGWHSYVADAVVVNKRRIWFSNSWGKNYCKDGHMFMSFDTAEQMLTPGPDGSVNMQVAVPVPPV